MICPNMSTTPVRCSHVTLENPKKYHLDYLDLDYFVRLDYLGLRYLRRKQIATVVLQLSCLLTICIHRVK